MNLSEQLEEAKLELQISPLIDVVFLLLIYFIVTAQIVKKEGDIPFMLPADVPAVEMVDIPVEARIRINPDDSVRLEGMTFDPSDRKLEGLIDQIIRLRNMAEAQRSPFFVTLDPNEDTVHRRIIDVMDACASAKVKNLTFAKKDS
jgi:biopolymer transport protein ExbD